jgi:hypothetical protein
LPLAGRELDRTIFHSVPRNYIHTAAVLLKSQRGPLDSPPLHPLSPPTASSRATRTNLRRQFQRHRSRLLSTAFCGTAQVARCGRRPRLSSAEWRPAPRPSGRRSRRMGMSLLARMATAVKGAPRRWDCREMKESFRPVGRAVARWSGKRRRNWAGCVLGRPGADVVCGLRILWEERAFVSDG